MESESLSRAREEDLSRERRAGMASWFCMTKFLCGGLAFVMETRVWSALSLASSSQSDWIWEMHSEMVSQSLPAANAITNAVVTKKECLIPIMLLKMKKLIKGRDILVWWFQCLCFVNFTIYWEALEHCLMCNTLHRTLRSISLMLPCQSKTQVQSIIHSSFISNTNVTKLQKRDWLLVFIGYCLISIKMLRLISCV